jgi:hypothetical protein
MKMLFKRKNRDIELFDHPVVNEFEKDVANSLGVTIYSEDKTIIGKLVKKEIEQSKVPSDKLLKYFIENREQLKIVTIRAYSDETKIDDGEEYPEGEELSNKEIPKTLKTYGPGIGFGITYGIYFHFLFNNLKDELSDHLKARRIPHSAKLYQRLVKYFDESNE